MAKTYKAQKSRGKGKLGWCTIFHHPLLKDRDGKSVRVRRGLGTRDENETDRLLEQLNKLLSDRSYWTPLGRKRAMREMMDSRVISIFYDKLKIEADPWQDRDRIIPLPGQEDGYAKIQVVGTTGAGKTTFIRQILGTDPRRERFPSTATGRTTTYESEIILKKGDKFQAVVSFLQKDIVRFYVEECIIAASMEWIDNRKTNSLIDKFLEHSDQRFRLKYVLGNLPDEEKNSVVLDDSPPELEDDSPPKLEERKGEHLIDQLTIEDNEREKMRENLRNYVKAIQTAADNLVEEVNEILGEPASMGDEDRDAYLSIIEDELVKSEYFNNLVEVIMKDIEEKFLRYENPGRFERNEANWPITWYCETPIRDSFLSFLSPFTSITATNFGRLLTPLVNGLRVVGPFQPKWMDEIPNIVLMDTEGLGHTWESANSLPTSITCRFEKADIILLVDNGQQTMLAAPQAVIRSVTVSGHDSKLSILFTHLDLVKGPNLPNNSAKTQHLRMSLENAMDGIVSELGDHVAKRLKRNLEEKVFYVGYIDKVLHEGAKFTRKQLLNLMGVFTAGSVVPESSGTAIPSYDMSTLTPAVDRATRSFHSHWKKTLTEEHWTRIKALSRRFALQWKDHYDNLQPVSDLIHYIQEDVHKFILSPIKWESENTSEESRHEVVSIISQNVFTALHRLIKDRLYYIPVSDWFLAYSQKGMGSTRIRASVIKEIYNRSAPLLNGMPPTRTETMFLNEIKDVVKKSAKSAGAKVRN